MLTSFRVLIAHEPLGGIVELGNVLVGSQCEIVKTAGAHQLNFRDLRLMHRLSV